MNLIKYCSRRMPPGLRAHLNRHNKMLPAHHSYRGDGVRRCSCTALAESLEMSVHANRSDLLPSTALFPLSPSCPRKTGWFISMRGEDNVLHEKTHSSLVLWGFMERFGGINLSDEWTNLTYCTTFTEYRSYTNHRFRIIDLEYAGSPTEWTQNTV